MPDIEKVVYSMERCICHVPDACRDCSYDAGHPYNECVECLLRDALELLKSHEQEESEWVKMTGMMIPELHGYHMCKNCEWHEDYRKRETLYPYCPACGAKMKNGVKWDD